MSPVHVSEHFGILIRKSSINEKSISMDVILEVMEVDFPLDEDHDLLSFGPHFGGEAVSEYIKRIEGLGLKYGDDFIDLSDTLPPWCKLLVEYKVE